MDGLRVFAGKIIFLGLFFVLIYTLTATVRVLGMAIHPSISIGIAALIAYIPCHLLAFTWPERRARQRSKSALERCLKPLRNARLPDGTATDFEPKWPIQQTSGAWAIDPTRMLIRVIGTFGKAEIDQLLPLTGIVSVEAVGINGASGTVDRGRFSISRRPKLVIHLSDGTKSHKMTIGFARQEHEAAKGWYQTIQRAIEDKNVSANAGAGLPQTQLTH